MNATISFLPESVMRDVTVWLYKMGLSQSAMCGVSEPVNLVVSETVRTCELIVSCFYTWLVVGNTHV